MLYTLKSVVNVGNGYHRFSFEPCSKEFVVDIPNSCLDEVFEALSNLSYKQPFTIEVRRCQEFGNLYKNRNGYEIRFQWSEDWITNVIPVDQRDNAANNDN